MILSFKHHQFPDNCPLIFSMSLLSVSFLPSFFFQKFFFKASSRSFGNDREDTSHGILHDISQQEHRPILSRQEGRHSNHGVRDFIFKHHSTRMRKKSRKVTLLSAESQITSPNSTRQSAVLLQSLSRALQQVWWYLESPFSLEVHHPHLKTAALSPLPHFPNQQCT